MIQKVTHTIRTGNTFQAVHIHFGKHQKEYSYVQVRKVKGELLINDQYVTHDYNELISKLTKNTPVILSFTGQGILSKKVAKETNYQSKVLFNANLDDFYWYEYQLEDTIFASIARKDLIDAELQSLEANQMSVISMNIGMFVVAAIQPFLAKNEVQVYEYELHFADHTLENFIKKEPSQMTTYTIGEDVLEASSLIGFSSVVHYLYPVTQIHFDTSIFTTKKIEFIYRRAFNILGIATLSFFLGSLLLSFIALQYYQQEQHKLQVALGTQNVAYNKLISLEKDRKNKAEILKESGLNDSNFLSFYLSKIGADVPEEISLSKLTVFPPTAKIKKEQRIYFDNDLVQVHGTVTSYKAFAMWIKLLKQHDWIGNVEIIDFQREDKTNQFIIKLTLKFDV